MSVGALSTKALREAVHALIDAATGATRLDDRITLDAAPQGREHAYYALEKWDTADRDSHKGRGIVSLEHTISARLAFSLIRYAHDQDAGRDAIDDALDSLRRRLYQPQAAQASNVANLTVTAFDQIERLHDSREWIVYDLTITALAGFDMAA